MRNSTTISQTKDLANEQGAYHFSKEDVHYLNFGIKCLIYITIISQLLNLSIYILHFFWEMKMISTHCKSCRICFQDSHCCVHLHAESLVDERDIITRIVETMHMGYTLMTMKRKRIKGWVMVLRVEVMYKDYACCYQQGKKGKNKDIIYS